MDEVGKARPGGGGFCHVAKICSFFLSVPLDAELLL